MEVLNMTNETWDVVQRALTCNYGNTSLSVLSIEEDVLQAMQAEFENKPFFKFRTQRFGQFPLIISYKKGEDTFLKFCTVVPVDKIPKDVNVIGSHTLHKTRMKDGSLLMLKARVAPHGNENDLKHGLTTICVTCSPTGIQVVESIAAVFGW